MAVMDECRKVMGEIWGEYVDSVRGNIGTANEFRRDGPLNPILYCDIVILCLLEPVPHTVYVGSRLAYERVKKTFM